MFTPVDVDANLVFLNDQMNPDLNGVGATRISLIDDYLRIKVVLKWLVQPALHFATLTFSSHLQYIAL